MKDKNIILINVILFYIINRFFALSYIYNKNIIQGMYKAIINIQNIFFEILPSINIKVNIYTIFILIIFNFYYYFFNRKKQIKKFRQGKEYGSARWGKIEDLKGYISTNNRKNMIFSKNINLNLYNNSDFTKRRNANVIVIGSSGSGKTRFIIKPNIMQMHSSYVISDPKGTVIKEVGKMLEEKTKTLLSNGEYKKDKNGKVISEPYKIKIFNTVNTKKSNKYNPFKYIKNEIDIVSFAKTLIENTSPPEAKSKDPFWDKAEELLYVTAVAGMLEMYPKEHHNFSTFLNVVAMFKPNKDGVTKIESFFEILEFGENELEIEANKESFAVRSYKKLKDTNEKTLQTILLTCDVRLMPFDIKEIRELLEEDELELDKIGEEKTALFIIPSDTDPTYRFLNALCYTQIFNINIKKADDEYNGELPIQIRFLIDEFANIGKIPGFDQKITTIRSRLMSVLIILQAKSQLKTMYKDTYETIIGNCDTEIFLGGKEKSTIKSLSEELGKETIDMNKKSNSYSKQKSRTLNEEKLGRNLMDMSELKTMKNDECIVEIRGLNPFKDKKFDITKHINYKKTYDGYGENIFDIEKYLEKERKTEEVENIIEKDNQLIDYYKELKKIIKI